MKTTTDFCASSPPDVASASRTAPRVVTVGWNVVEGTVVDTAAVLARSIAPFGFGVDSFVESASGRRPSPAAASPLVKLG